MWLCKNYYLIVNNMDEIKNILEQDEKVLWEGKPKFWPFFFGNSIPSTIFVIFWMGFLFVFWLKAGPIVFLLPHFWVGIFLLFGPTLYNSFSYKNTYYAITNKRVVLQKGWIGRSFETVDFDKITNTEVTIGIFDRLLMQNTGSILISTAGSFTYTRQGQVSRPYTISHIEKPYDVAKFFEKAEYDVKTDIEYPNKFRPQENPGYNTDYNPKQ